MPCTQPIKVINRTRTFIPDNTRYKNVVPCGKCDGCRLDLQNYWTARAIAEYIYYQSIGGSTLFLTFTYSNRYLPKFWYDHNGKKAFVPGFSYTDVKRFLNSYRKHFERKFKVPGKISYLWCSEYGTDARYTQRSHYHVLLHLPPLIWNCYTLDKHKSLIQQLWHYGMVRYSEPSIGDCIVSSDVACKYVAKYCSKDFSYFNQPQLMEYLNVLDADERELRLKRFRPFAPHHWQSHGYGSSLVTILRGKNFSELVDILLDGYCFNSKSDKEQVQRTFFKLPSYITDKLLYNVFPDGRRQLTETGRSVMAAVFFISLRNELRDLSKQISIEYIQHHCFGVDFDQYFKLYGVHDADGLNQWFNDIIDSRLYEFVIYRKVWKGVISPDQDSIDYLDSLSPTKFEYLSKEKYLDSLSNNPIDFPLFDCGYFNFQKILDPDFQDKLLYYDSARRFCDFHIFQEVLNKVNQAYNMNVSESFLIRRNERSRLKHLHRNLQV